MTEAHTSALLDHVGKRNHCIDWDEVKLPAKNPGKKKRGILEATEIQTAGRQSSQQGCGLSPSADDVLHAVVSVLQFWHICSNENDDSGFIEIYLLLSFINFWS